MGKNKKLLTLFALASSLTFSGGLAMLPMLHQALVIEEKYLSSEEFYHYAALAQSIPGVTVVTTACLLGEKINQKSGRLFACLGAITPVLVIMSLLTILYQSIPQTGMIIFIFTAVRATAGIFIFEACRDMAKIIIKDNVKAQLLVGLSVLLLVGFNLSAIYVLVLCFFLALVSLKRGEKR